MLLTTKITEVQNNLRLNSEGTYKHMKKTESLSSFSSPDHFLTHKTHKTTVPSGSNTKKLIIKKPATP